MNTTPKTLVERIDLEECASWLETGAESVCQLRAETWAVAIRGALATLNVPPELGQLAPYVEHHTACRVAKRMGETACSCGLTEMLATLSSKGRGEDERSRGFMDGLDHIAHFINALDSGDMTAKQVRTAIYSECLTARAAHPTPEPRSPVGMREALNGYRAAASFVAADAWDGCSDCIEVLRAARAADVDWDWAGDNNRAAAELARIRKFARGFNETPDDAALAQTPPALSGGGELREAVELAAEAVHRARWWPGDEAHITPFAAEDQRGQEYCRRIARAVLALDLAALAQSTPAVGEGSTLRDLEVWGMAEEECKRVLAGTIFTDEVSEDQRKGFKSGVEFCIGAIRIVSSSVCRALPLPVVPHGGGL